jgi:trans-2-enoyl-CoA reductase
MENGPGVDEAVALLKEHGAFAAVTTDYARTAAFRRLLADLPAPTLALNGLGGRGATEAIRTLGVGGTLVTYGGKPFDVPSSHLIDGGITLKGFSLERKMQSVNKEAAQTIVSEAEKLSPKILLETHALSKFDAALARHQEPFRNRKVVLLNKN